MAEPPQEITLRICEAASEALETPIEELPPLSDAVDPEALEAIISSTADARPPAVTVRFEYADLELVVLSKEIVQARPIGRNGLVQ